MAAPCVCRCCLGGRQARYRPGSVRHLDHRDRATLESNSGFQLLKRRWVVERTLAWLNPQPASGEGFRGIYRKLCCLASYRQHQAAYQKACQGLKVLIGITSQTLLALGSAVAFSCPRRGDPASNRSDQQQDGEPHERPAPGGVVIENKKKKRHAAGEKTGGEAGQARLLRQPMGNEPLAGCTAYGSVTMRTGRMWRVWRICVWSNTLTHI
jgi:transposase